MKIIDVSRPPKEIWLGRDGENSWRPIAFECASLLAKRPDGIITVWMEANGNKFPLSADMDGTKAVWYPQQEELFLDGSRIEVSIQSGEDVGTSAIIGCKVDESLIGNGEHPAQEMPPWGVEVVQDVTEQADRAEDAVSHYPQIRNDYWWVWDVESGEWVNTGVKATGEGGGTAANAVLYTQQSLSDAQKEQARENVDAPSASVLAAMLIPILRDGLYGTDQTAAITALEIALGGTPEPEDPIETYTPTMSDGYINVTTGATGGTSTYKHTEIIPVREGDKVYGTTYDSTYSVTVQRIRSRFTAAYDANGEIYPSGGVSDQHDYAVETPFVVPSGVYGVVFSIVNSLANQVVVYVDKSERVGA